MNTDKTEQQASAFPLVGFDPGMTLRDYFAAKAMGAIISNINAWGPDLQGSMDTRDVALVAHQFADAMLAERSKKP